MSNRKKKNFDNNIIKTLDSYFGGCYDYSERKRRIQA
jgi:hypothetical protein